MFQAIQCSFCCAGLSNLCNFIDQQLENIDLELRSKFKSRWIFNLATKYVCDSQESRLATVK